MAPETPTENTDLLPRLLEDVQQFSDQTAVTAVATLKELLRSCQAESTVVNALSMVSTLAQLHTAVNQVIARVFVVKRHEVVPHLEEWNALCLQLAHSVMNVADQT